MHKNDDSPPPPELDWHDGLVPVSRRFNDPYFSLDNGLEETRYVFLGGNGLPGRFTGDFRIAELGFGTGLNFLVTLSAWIAQGRPGHLHFTSFEAFPMAAADMATALAAFAELAPLATILVNAIASGPGPYNPDPTVTLTLIRGDARNTVPPWDRLADAWFLDGFSPARNPEMWGDDLMAEVTRHLAPGGTLATYTAAGHVRRALTVAGLEVVRMPGYGRKRHMTVAKETGTRKPL